MSFHTLRDRFVELIRPELRDQVDLRLEVFPHAHDQPSRLLVRVGRQDITLGVGHWHQTDNGAPDGQPAKSFTAFEAVDRMVNSPAPAYWVDARLRLKAAGVTEATDKGALGDDTEIDRIVCALGWLDRRVGNRTVTKDAQATGDRPFSALESVFRNVRLNGSVPVVNGRPSVG